MAPSGFEREGAGTPDDGVIDVPRLLSALGARKWWIVVPTLLSFCAAAAFVAVVSPRYTGVAKVMLENQESYFTRPDKSGGDLATPQVYDPEGVQSEAETFATDDLAHKAVDKLNLLKTKEYNPEIHNPLSMLIAMLSGRSNADPADRAAETFLSKLTVFAVAKSRVLQVEFSSSDPELAARGANTAAELFLAAKEDARKAGTRADAAWLSNAIDKLRVRVAEADAKMEAYRAESGLLAGANGMTVPGQQLAEINTQIATARAAQTAASSKAQLMRQMLREGRLDAVPDVAKDDSLRRYAETRVTLKAQIAQESRTLLPGHPRMRELAGQLAGLDAEMRSAATKVVAGLEDEARLAGDQVRGLEAAIAKQSRAVVTGNADEVKLRALELDAKTAREQLESYIQKYHEALSHDADNAQPPNARITARAVPPRLPVFPKKVPTLLLSTLAGFFLSAGVVVARALLTDSPRMGAATRSEDNRSEPFEERLVTRAAPQAAPRDVGPPNELDVFLDGLADLAKPDDSAPILVGAEGGAAALSVALSSARRLSRRGRTVLLDLGATQPWLADAFDHRGDEGAANMGLSDLIDDRADFSSVLHRDLSSELDILPAGSGMVIAEGVAPVLEALMGTYAFVVVHASDWRSDAALEVIDSVAALIVCAPGARLAAMRERARESLAESSVVVLGVATSGERAERERAA